MAILPHITNSQLERVLDQNVDEEKDVKFMAMEEVAEEQSLEIPTVEQLLDEADKLNKAFQETQKSPYDTKIVDIHEVSNSDLQSMPDDDLRSVSGLHTADSNDTYKNKVSQSDHIFQDDHEFAERLSLPDHMDHICEEVSSLHSRLGDMNFLSDALKDTLLQLLKDSIKSSVSKSITDELPHVEAQVQKNLQDQLPNLLLKPMYKEFNAFKKLESQRFVLFQKELSKSLYKNMKKSIRLKDMVSLLEAADVFKKANAEGEKWEKHNPAEEKDAQHPDQTKGE
ncbi:hypothetical protein Tco_0913245 [Tanacetum coccineum]